MSDLVRTDTALAPFDLPREDAERYRNALGMVRASLTSENSVRAYFASWSAWLAWCDAKGLPLFSASALDVHRHVSELASAGLAKNTVKHRLTVLKQFYAACVVTGLMPTNPAREVKLPRIDKPKHTPWLTADELQRLLRAFDGDFSWRGRRDRLILLCLAGLGLRRTEVASLTWEMFRVTAVGMTLSTTVKGGKMKHFGVPKALERELAWWGVNGRRLAAGGRAFSTLLRGSLWTDGPVPSDDVVYEVVKDAATRAGLADVSPHALRRTLATLASLAGTPLADIQKTLGHAKLSTTEIYVQDSGLPSVAAGEGVLDAALKKP